MAVSTARGLKVVVGDATVEASGRVVDVPLSAERVTARLSDDRFTGSVELTRGACGAGVVALAVRPRPARVIFIGVPDDVAVICRDGCPADALDKPRTLADFPSIAIEKGEATIAVELKHPAYRPKVLSTRIFPGPNRIHVELEPRCE